MAVSIDNVYQRVLALANKEQRGYITPQEFNLLAYKAQMDIFENNIQEYKSFVLRPNINDDIPTIIEILKERMLPFRVYKAPCTINNTTSSATGSNTFIGGKNTIRVSTLILPDNVHYLESITNSPAGGIYEQVEPDEWNRILSNSKLRPFSANHGIYIRANMYENPNTVMVAPGQGYNDAQGGLNSTALFYCNYIKKPSSPKWGYVVTNEKALFNPNTTVNFELHASEESALTNKILEFAGIIVNKPGLSEVILRNEQMKEVIKNK